MGLASPVKYNSVSSMERKIEKYFMERANFKTEVYSPKKGEIIEVCEQAPLHLTGLCDYLGISDQELDEYQKAELNDKLQFLNNTDVDEEVSITYFVPDKKKSGGAYITKRGIVLKVREYEKDIIMDDGTEIPIDDVFAIEGNQFDETKSI